MPRKTNTEKKTDKRGKPIREKRDPRPKPKPNPYAPAGRRGRKEDPRLTTLPSGDHHGQRARLFVAPLNPNQ